MKSVMKFSARPAREQRSRRTPSVPHDALPSPYVSRERVGVEITPDGRPLSAPGVLQLRRLANLLSLYAPHDGAFQLRLPGARAVRRSRTTSGPVHATVRPALCVVAQGAKVVMLGREVFEYDPTRLLVFSVDLPVLSHVVRASHADPFLGFVLDLNPQRVRELAAKVYPDGVPKPSSSRALYVGESTDALVEAVSRLLELMAQPTDAELLAPLVVDEILIRLLRSRIGPRVAQIGQATSGVQRIGEAVSWICTHFAQPITVDEMAASVRLMLFQQLDASEACHRVGYLSPSQFSREYSRFFGSAPTKDMARLRTENFTRGDARGDMHDANT